MPTGVSNVDWMVDWHYGMSMQGDPTLRPASMGDGSVKLPPVLGEIETNPLSYEENEAAKAITAGLTVRDGDNVNFAGATIQITSNYVNGQDVLSLTNAGTITRIWDAGTGTLTLTGSDTLANYQAALRAVKYQNTSHSPSTATRTVSFKVNDGAADSNLVRGTSRSRR